MSHLLIVAHGSRREASNQEVRELAIKMSQINAGSYDSIQAGFLELAEPSILEGLIKLINNGATHIDVFPYFLSAGRHVSEDVPEQLKIVQQQWPDIKINLKPYLGSNNALPELILESLSNHL